MFSSISGFPGTHSARVEPKQSQNLPHLPSFCFLYPEVISEDMKLGESSKLCKAIYISNHVAIIHRLPRTQNSAQSHATTREMTSHTLENNTGIQFINTFFPTRPSGATYRRRVRRHVINRSWQVRKDQARSLTFPGNRPLRAFEPRPTCRCYQPGNGKNVARESCLHCQSDLFSSRMEPCNPYRVEANGDFKGEGSVALAGECNVTEEGSALEPGNPRNLLGSGDRDPFSSFPISAGPNHRRIEMLLHHCESESLNSVNLFNRNASSC